jgi:hypothetical protein
VSSHGASHCHWPLVPSPSPLATATRSPIRVQRAGTRDAHYVHLRVSCAGSLVGLAGWKAVEGFANKPGQSMSLRLLAALLVACSTPFEQLQPRATTMTGRNPKRSGRKMIQLYVTSSWTSMSLRKAIQTVRAALAAPVSAVMASARPRPSRAC